MSITASNKVADNVVAGLLAVITADGENFPLPAFGNRSTEAGSKSRCEVRAGNFVRGSEQMALLPGSPPLVNSSWYYPHRRGFVSFTVVSQRHTATQSTPDNKHSECVGRARDIMDITQQLLTPAVMAGYEIVDVVDQGDVWSYDQQERVDRTEVRFQFDLWIPPARYTDS